MKRRWGSTHDELSEKLPPAGFEALVRHFGGQVLRVPSSMRETREQRRARELEVLNRGGTYGDAAAAGGVSISTAKRDANS